MARQPFATHDAIAIGEKDLGVVISGLARRNQSASATFYHHVITGKGALSILDGGRSMPWLGSKNGGRWAFRLPPGGAAHMPSAAPYRR